MSVSSSDQLRHSRFQLHSVWKFSLFELPVEALILDSSLHKNLHLRSLNCSSFLFLLLLNKIVKYRMDLNRNSFLFLLLLNKILENCKIVWNDSGLFKVLFWTYVAYNFNVITLLNYCINSYTRFLNVFEFRGFVNKSA